MIIRLIIFESTIIAILVSYLLLAIQICLSVNLTPGSNYLPRLTPFTQTYPFLKFFMLIKVSPDDVTLKVPLNKDGKVLASLDLVHFSMD